MLLTKNVQHYQILSYVDFIIKLFMSEIVFIIKLSCFLHNFNHIFRVNKLLDDTMAKDNTSSLETFRNIVCKWEIS